MTPHLALTLAFDGIGLAKRTPEGWEQVGHVSLDAPDLADRLHTLRDMAETLSPDGLATAVVLPDEQILNRHLPDVAETPGAVAAALDGLTPYAVSELVFDWRPHPGGGVVVAAVARETIDEALAFARQFGFNPVSLTARPAPDLPFVAEPDFGTGTPVIPPAAAVATMADPVAAAVDAATPEEAAPTPALADTGSRPANEAEPAHTPPADTSASDDPAAPVVPSESEGFATRRARSRGPAEPVAAAADDTAAGAPFLLEAGQHAAPSEAADATDPTARIAAMPARLTVLDAGAPAIHSLADANRPGGLDDAPAGADGPASGENVAADPGPGDPAMVASRTPDAAGTDGLVTPPRLVAATRNAGSAATRPGPVGVSRRVGVGKPGLSAATPRGGKSGATPPLRRAKSEAGAARLAEPSSAARSAGASMTVRPLGDPALAESSRTLSSVPVIVGLVAALLIALAAAVGLSRVVIGWLAPPAEVAAIPLDTPITAAVPGPSDATAVAPAAPVQEQTEPRGPDVPDSDADVAAAPAAQATSAYPQSVLTPVLPTAPGAAVSAPRTGASAQAAVATAVPPGTSAPAPETTEALPSEDTGEEPGPGPALAAEVVGSTGIVGDGPLTDGVARPGADTATATPVPPARLAAPVSGDALPAIPSQFVLGPGPAPIPDPARPTPVATPPTLAIVLAAFDPAVTLEDPLALVAPGQSATGDLPEVQPVPPPGVAYRLDDRGLVVATPEGAVSPDGHRVTLGRPALVPPARPLTASPSVALASDPATLQRLARLRPPPRPAAPAATPETEGASNPSPDGPAPATDTAEGTTTGTGGADVTAALTAALSVARTPDASTIRPAPRPATLATAVAPATAESAASGLATATARAVAVSLRPAARPAGLDAIAAAASVRIAALPPAETASSPATAPEAEPQPGFSYDDGEPETASAAPRIPSSASVARQATVQGALNLNELNLIGVYGTASDRRALVRLPSGRFVKVEIGDRVDGGQVAEIGDRDLRYIKSGRSILLSMPRG